MSSLNISKKSVPKIDSERARALRKIMAQLLRQALDTLQDQVAPHGLRAVAACTLLAAFERNLEVSREAPAAVWNWLVVTGGDCMRFARLNGIPGPDAVRLAVAALKDPAAGEDAHDVACVVIERSNHLSMIALEDILTLTDGEPVPEHARRLVRVIEAVHEQTGLPNELLRALRERWSRSGQAYLREAAVQLTRLLPGIDERFVSSMLADSAPGVRGETVSLLEQSEDDERALGLLQNQLAIEEHVRVRSDLHSAIGALLRTKAR